GANEGHEGGALGFEGGADIAYVGAAKVHVVYLVEARKRGSNVLDPPRNERRGDEVHPDPLEGRGADPSADHAIDRGGRRERVPGVFIEAFEAMGRQDLGNDHLGVLDAPEERLQGATKVLAFEIVHGYASLGATCAVSSIAAVSFTRRGRAGNGNPL